MKLNLKLMPTRSYKSTNEFLHLMLIYGLCVAKQRERGRNCNTKLFLFIYGAKQFNVNKIKIKLGTDKCGTVLCIRKMEFVKWNMVIKLGSVVLAKILYMELIDGKTQ